MNVLAISTSSDIISVSVVKGCGHMAELYIKTGTKHSVMLLPAIDQVLKLTGTDIGEIGLFACDTGPGSFTGIRIGVSTVNGLAAAGTKQAVGIPSLDILAAGVSDRCGTVVSCIYARNDQVYGGIYTGRSAEGEYYAGNAEGFIRLIAGKAEGEMLFVGDGASVFKDLIISAFGADARFCAEKDDHISAGTAARIAAERGAGLSPIVPFYIKQASAKEKKGG
jgi:tRNA threonylcarbamoyladenosine biosynthesis protein TsaB